MMLPRFPNFSCYFFSRLRDSMEGLAKTYKVNRIHNRQYPFNLYGSCMASIESFSFFNTWKQNFVIISLKKQKIFSDCFGVSATVFQMILFEQPWLEGIGIKQKKNIYVVQSKISLVKRSARGLIDLKQKVFLLIERHNNSSITFNAKKSHWTFSSIVLSKSSMSSVTSGLINRFYN